MTAVSARAEALEQLGRAFKTAMVAVRRLRGRETHRPGELSYAQYTLLFSLADRGSEVSARDLACAADLSPPSVTQMLDHLATMGLVARARSELDKRVVLTSLTERGQALIGEHRARFEPRWRAAMAEFDDRELAIAAAVLTRLGALFEQFDSDA
ncbi:MAG: MarR family transcriptional regulator, organic hydroperoxide resistance regulator [Solirubrobacteraceae bacterium]|jgi:DNA-binding MarR family transcriptional regulator|nr:MarR family transcriptional regulator, organic hydroperoxide resistance regulator [Solirubrobacteraceae bacterium]